MGLSLIATKLFFKKLCAQYTTAKYRSYIECESIYLHQKNIQSYIPYAPEPRKSLSLNPVKDVLSSIAKLNTT
jgi:hypothetical protein